MPLTQAHFQSWLDLYGETWRKKDAAGFANLFAESGLYYWTPFHEPKKGREGIAAAFSKAVANEADIDFGARILYVEAQLGAAHWSAAFTRPDTGKRAHYDGVLVVQFDTDGLAISQRQWWHSDE